MFMEYQRGRGQEPVMVAGSIRPFVAVKAMGVFLSSVRRVEFQTTDFAGASTKRRGVRPVKVALVHWVTLVQETSPDKSNVADLPSRAQKRDSKCVEEAKLQKPQVDAMLR